MTQYQYLLYKLTSILSVFASQKKRFFDLISNVIPFGHPKSSLSKIILSLPSKLERSILGLLSYQSDQKSQPNSGATAIPRGSAKSLVIII